jgi:anti-sigma-K factor RskA
VGESVADLAKRFLLSSSLEDKHTAEAALEAWLEKEAGDPVLMGIFVEALKGVLEEAPEINEAGWQQKVSVLNNLVVVAELSVKGG